jgi:hypothetical protein
MKRIALHLLLALALIFNGSLAFGAGVQMAKCCCHHAHVQAAVTSNHDTQCPCAPKQSCSTDCQMLCVAHVPAAAIAQFQVPQIALQNAQTIRIESALHSRGDSPPTRPPIA